LSGRYAENAEDLRTMDCPAITDKANQKHRRERAEDSKQDNSERFREQAEGSEDDVLSKLNPFVILVAFC
jgi:hypothetical protein